MVTTANVNLRTGPGIQFKSKCIIPKGTILDVKGINNNWCEINYNKQHGYVFKNYLIISQEIETSNARIFSFWVPMFLLPIFWSVFIINPWKPGYRLLTLRGHLLLFTILVLIPLCKFLAWKVGDEIFLSWTIVQSITSIFNILDLISIIILLYNAVKKPSIESAITAILVFSLIVYGSKFDGVSEFCLSLIITTMAYDRILLESLESKSINTPLNKRFFTGFRYE